MDQHQINARAAAVGLRTDDTGALWGCTGSLRAFAINLLADAGKPMQTDQARKPLTRGGMQQLVRTALDQDQLLHDHVCLIRAVEAYHGIGDA